MDSTVIDLVAVANALPEKHKKLGYLILQHRDAHSAYTDLKLASDFMGSVREIARGSHDAEADSIAENSGLALFHSAIVLYARATKTQSKHRRAYDLTRSFDPEERRAHDTLCGLRDDAIAHFGPGGSYSGPAWQKEGVFVPTRMSPNAAPPVDARGAPTLARDTKNEGGNLELP
jgi:hypothetical protein